MTDNLRLEDRRYGYTAKILNRFKNAIADYVTKRRNHREKRLHRPQKLFRNIFVFQVSGAGARAAGLHIDD